jgi:hypothetical protein
MGATYTRQSSSGIVDGGVIEATDLNNEFDQLLAAFAVSSGHTHDGTAAEGGPITKLLGTSITIGDGTAGTDIAVTFDGETSDGVLTWMEDEDLFKFSDAINVGVDDTGYDVKFFGDTASRYWLWDTSADGVVQRGTLTVGVDDTGHDVKFFGATSGAYMLWDESADDLVLAGAAGIDLAGDIDVDGTANLDAVDIDGAVQLDSTFTVGVNDTGYDVKFFGATSGAYMLWDESTDDLVLAGASKLYLYDAAGGEYLSSSGSALTIGSGSAAWELPAADGSANQILKTDGSGNLDWTTVVGTITALNNATANELVTVGATTTELDAEANLTFDGTTLAATALTVDDVAVDGKVVTMTGSASDTAVLTAGTNGTLSIVTTDAAAAAANIQITADGTVDIDSAGVLTLDSGAAINIEPAAGSAILLDGTISVDAGVVTGATSVTSTAFVGALTGNVTGNASGTAATVTTAAQSNITSLGTLTTLTVDNVITNGATIGHTSDADLITLADGAVTVAGTIGSGAITSTGIVTGTAFTAGSAVLAESELELLDGLTAGTAIASKVVTTDANIDTTGQRNLTISGEIDAATGDFSGAVDVAGATTVAALTASGLVTAGAKIDLNGTELILDADADTSITADTDDTIDIRIAGADDFQFTANTFTIPSGSTVAIAAGGAITNAGSMAPDITSTGKALVMGF